MDAQSTSDQVRYLLQFWQRMTTIYGRSWTSQWGADPITEHGEVSTAARDLMTLLTGLTQREIDRGFEACILEGGEFPPSAARFRALCLGIPSLASVRIDLQAPPHERDPFTIMVWSYVDAYAYRNASARDSERMLTNAYEHAVEQRKRGKPLPHVPLAVTHEKRISVKATPEEAAKHVAELKEIFGEGVDASQVTE